MGDTLTITLTDRAPVTIVKADWPIIASADEHDGEVEQQSDRRWKLLVRQHADGRSVVYGVYSTAFQGERDRRAGELLEDPAEIPLAINRVATRLDFDPWLAQGCIADLPAETLT